MPRQQYNFRLDTELMDAIDAKRGKLDRTAYIERVLARAVRGEPSLRIVNAKLNKILRRLKID